MDGFVAEEFVFVDQFDTAGDEIPAPDRQQGLNQIGIPPLK